MDTVEPANIPDAPKTVKADEGNGTAAKVERAGENPPVDHASITKVEREPEETPLAELNLTNLRKVSPLRGVRNMHRRG